MDVNVENLGATKRKLSLEIPADQVRKEINQMVKVLRKEAKIKGFRQGKVPEGMVKRLFAAHIEQEVSQKLMQETLPDAMDKLEDTVISQPTLEESHFVEGDPFTFSVIFEVKPDFQVGPYTGLSLKREVMPVTDEMVDQRIEELRKSYSTTKSIEEDRPIQKGDIAIIDYKALEGDQPLEGGENQNFQLEVGSSRFHPDFDAALEGMAKGSQKEIAVTFEPDYYNPKLAGKDIRFDVTLTDIKEKILPELNDEFAKDLGQNLETLDALKDWIKNDMQQYYDRQARDRMELQIREKLIETTEIEAPEIMTNHEVDNMVQQTKYNLQRSGFDLEKVGLSEAKLREESRGEAEKRVKMGLILEKISKNENITVSQEELDRELTKIAENVGQPFEAVKDIYKKNNMIDSLEDAQLTEKTLNFIIDSANIEDVEVKEASEAETESTE